MKAFDRSRYPQLTIDELRKTTALTVNEVCGAMLSSPATVRAAIKRGEIPAIQSGRIIRIPTSFVLRELGVEV